MTQEETLNTLMKMRAWRAWGKEQKEEERPEMPEQKEVDEAFDVCIKLLQRLSLPSDLDEAAENYYEQDCPYSGEARVINNEYDLWFPSQAIEDAFKAGAEWMAGQGETLDSFIWRDEDDKLFIEAFVDENKFKMSEDVTVQIRKK